MCLSLDCGEASRDCLSKACCCLLTQQFSYCLFDKDDPDLEPEKFTKDFCKSMSQHVIRVKSLPQQCMQYPDIVAEVKKKDNDTVHPTQWL